MLTGIRKAFETGILRLVLVALMGLLVLSFAVWGIGDIFRGGTTSTLATVGRTQISVAQFQQLFNREIQNVGREFGRGITPEQARLLGLDNRVLQRLLTEATLDERGREFGLGIDDETIRTRITTAPAFRGITGQFDRANFQEVLRQNGLTEAAYIDLERKLAVRLQMSGAFAEGAGTPKALVDLAARYNAETRVADYVTIGAKLVGEIPAPDNDALARFFEPRKASFRAPEYRKLNLIVLSPEELAPFSTVPDDRLNLEVARERDRLDRRTIQQIPFPSPADAEAAAQKIKDGATFEAIAAERNIAPTDLTLGALSRADVADPAVRDAAFALEANTVSAPVAGRFGTVLLRVTAISPFNEEQVREEVRRRLALDIARDSVNDLHDKIEKDRLSGLPIAELAVRAGVSPIVVDAVDAQGRDPTETPLNLAGERDLLAAAFRADVGSDNDPVLIRQSGTYIWYEIASITPARDRTLEDVRERVLTRWQEEEVKARIGAAATEMVTSLKAGETLAAIAAKLGLEVRTTKPLARAAIEGDWGQPSIQALFSTPKGQVADAPAIDGIDRLVFVVKDVTVPASAGLEARILSQLTQSIEDDILGQYITRLQSDFGTSVNRTLLRRAVGGET